jgi:soluble lytic murein transglycosylase-like protein
MSIEPSIDAVASAPGAAAAKKMTAPAASPSVPFEEYLGKPAGGEPVSPAAVAELLRLKMLSSAVSIGEADGKQAQAASTGVQGILDRFLEQLPKGAAATTAAPADTTAAAEAQGSIAAAAVEQPLPPGSSLEAIIQKASSRYGVDGGLIRAVIRAESGFNSKAVSSAGAQGLMQLMPSTARGLGVTDSFDPEQNVMAGTRFLKDMLQRYGGNVDQALAAYNWGPGNVDKHGTDRLPRETRTYLAKVKGYYGQYVG